MKFICSSVYLLALGHRSSTESVSSITLPYRAPCSSSWDAGPCRLCWEGTSAQMALNHRLSEYCLSPKTKQDWLHQFILPEGGICKIIRCRKQSNIFEHNYPSTQP